MKTPVAKAFKYCTALYVIHQRIWGLPSSQCPKLPRYFMQVCSNKRERPEHVHLAREVCVWLVRGRGCEGGFRFWSLAEHWTGQTTEVHVGCNGGPIIDPCSNTRFLANE